MSETISHEQSDTISEKRKPKAIDAEETVNPVLARLIEEVRNEGAIRVTTFMGSSYSGPGLM